MNACIYMIDRIYIYIYTHRIEIQNIIYTYHIPHVSWSNPPIFAAFPWDAHLGDQQGAHPCAGAAAQGMAELKALKAVAASEGQP